MRILPEYNQCQLELRVSTPFILLMQFVRQKLRSAFLAGTSVNLNLVNCSKTRSLLTRSKKHDFYVGTPIKNFVPPSPLLPRACVLGIVSHLLFWREIWWIWNWWLIRSSVWHRLYSGRVRMRFLRNFDKKKNWHPSSFVERVCSTNGSRQGVISSFKFSLTWRQLLFDVRYQLLDYFVFDVRYQWNTITCIVHIYNSVGFQYPTTLRGGSLLSIFSLILRKVIFCHKTE